MTLTLEQVEKEAQGDFDFELDFIDTNPAPADPLAALSKEIDRAGDLDKQIKALKSELDSLKKKIKAEAGGMDRKTLYGEKYKAVISDTTVTEIPVQAAWDLITRHGLEVDRFFSVNVTPFKALVGETGIETVGGKIEKIENHSVSFK